MYIIIAAIFFQGCMHEQSSENESINPEVTKQVLDHHWQTFRDNDLEGVMEDYTEESILITPDTTYRGLEEIRQNFVNAFEAFPSEENPLTLNKSVVEKDVGYILWEASTPEFELVFATDTFIIRDGKIIRQTYGGVTQQNLE
ncbi:MAG: nuclear transport factor 2 family protein [Balneolaceae bacterium]|nr:nuclear transport factor 2 family protein [Balneolaceae bacterium]